MDKDELRLKILRLIESNPSMSQRQIADELGISLGGVNYCLRALAEVGWIKVGNFAKSGHNWLPLFTTPRGIKKDKITASFLAKKRHECEALRRNYAAKVERTSPKQLTLFTTKLSFFRCWYFSAAAESF